jgi:hypothetical protein
MPKYFTGTYTTTQVPRVPATDNPATASSTGAIRVNSIVRADVAMPASIIGGFAPGGGTAAELRSGDAA